MAGQVFPAPLSRLFVPTLLPCLLFILMLSWWSSWWWHGVDYAVPTVTCSKATGEGAIVACDLWMTVLPVAPAPCWWSYSERPERRTYWSGEEGNCSMFGLTVLIADNILQTGYFPTSLMIDILNVNLVMLSNKSWNKSACFSSDLKTRIEAQKRYRHIIFYYKNLQSSRCLFVNVL